MSKNPTKSGSNTPENVPIMFPKCSQNVPQMFPEKIEKLGNIDKKAANPLRINDLHFGRLRRERLGSFIR